ncbi:MAG: hypothetical protein KKG88_05460, partial [Proteobacteria bacterium]|nr:hypothetical protein [Pseudomonadota bacterium]
GSTVEERSFPVALTAIFMANPPENSGERGAVRLLCAYAHNCCKVFPGTCQGDLCPTGSVQNVLVIFIVPGIVESVSHRLSMTNCSLP